ncbi:MAG TPA: alpha-2-macroglobulin family protein [Candidatus Obscuribacterales bacterium]
MNSLPTKRSSAARLGLFGVVIGVCCATLICLASQAMMVRRPGPLPPAKDGEGLVFRLSEGSSTPQSVKPMKEAAWSTLSADRVAALLARLPVLKPAQKAEFAFPVRSLPVPRTGKTITMAFPPAKEVAPHVVPDNSPLTVIRHSPDGIIDSTVPSLSVTFSQPMVAVTSHQDIAKGNMPVTLQPQPKGTWRWIGSKTILFEPEHKHFPMATGYDVSVPAGTMSASGKKMENAFTFKFSTSTPTVKQFTPNYGPTDLNPLMVATFDQNIDPASVLNKISVMADGSSAALRLASADEIKKDAAVSETFKADKSVAFKTVSSLPRDRNIRVTIGPGVPSAEGPLTSKNAQTFSFRTYGPMKLLPPSHWQREYEPRTPWFISFTNPIDTKAFDASKIKIQPPVEDSIITAAGISLSFNGNSKGRTTYSINLGTAIKDTFGQSLEPTGFIQIKVGPATPQVQYSQNFITIDPSGPLTWNLVSINVPTIHVALYAVQPTDWPDYMRDAQAFLAQRQAVYSADVHPRVLEDQYVETPIDLRRALHGKYGHVVVAVEAQSGQMRYKEKFQNWVQSTDIGLDAFADNDQLLAWTTSLKDAKPMAGVQIQLIGPATSSRTTDQNGLATLQLNDLGSRSIQEILVARKGADTAIGGNGLNSYVLSKKPAVDEARWYVLTDRHLYKPGEDVHVKGWVRRITRGPTGDVAKLAGPSKLLNYEVFDSTNNSIASGKTELGNADGFNFAFTVPKAANLGYSRIQLKLDKTDPENMAGNPHEANFEIQEFRKPEFEVNVKTETEAPHVIKQHAIVAVNAKYYTGGGLANASVNWNVNANPTNYSPPNWSEFVFGIHRWFWEFGPIGRPYPPSTFKNFTGQTDGAGKHLLRIDFDSVSPAEPMSVNVVATVQDVNRQAWNGTTSLLVHPSKLYVGLKSDRMFVREKQPIKTAAIVTDIDGKAVAGRAVKFKIYREIGTWVDGEYKTEEKDVVEQTVVSSAEPIQVSLPTARGGSYKIEATVMDDDERPNFTQMTVWVAGAESAPIQKNVEQQRVLMIPDHQEYQPGGTAEIAIQSPFVPAEGLMTIRREGLVSHQHFSMTEASRVLNVPIVDSYTPNVTVQVDLVGVTTRSDDKQKTIAVPAFASGSVDLKIPPTKRTLKLAVDPKNSEIEPGAETSIDVVLKDAEGKPIANGDVAVVVVDESVLALSGYKLPDPITIFYSERYPFVNDFHIRQSVQVPSDFAEETSSRARYIPVAQAMRHGIVGGAAFGVAATAPGERAIRFAVPQAIADTNMFQVEPSALDGRYARAKGSALALLPTPPGIAVRKDFSALALFEPSLHTDANGKVSVALKLPDNLTRYRIMAVAAAGDKQFGMAESMITARMPMMVRPSAPRFLRFGDKMQLPVVIENQTHQPLKVEVAVRATNLALTAEHGKVVMVPADDRVEVRFPARTEDAGEAAVQIAAAAGDMADAATVLMPVWTPATTEAFATYGTIDNGSVVQPIKAPSDVFPQFGNLEVTTSSTALQGLTDAFIYLVHYPYECSEQIASRMLAVAALRDVLTAFKSPDMPTAYALNAQMSADIDILRSRQHWDGGFGLWDQSDQHQFPYVTVHVAHALQMARDKGYAVPDDVIDKVKTYLRNIDSKFDAHYTEETKGAIQAYAIYVRNQLHDCDPAVARRVVTRVGIDKLSAEALGWILPTLTKDANSQDVVAVIRTKLNNSVRETASTAEFHTSYGDNDYLLMCSGRRVDGVLLDELIVDQPQSDLIPKLVNGLLAHRKQGRWENTQENAFILLALDRYFNQYEKVTPEFVARVWLGDRFAGEANFVGHTTEREEIDVPLKYLFDHPSQDSVAISKDGPGRLYYRIGMQYAPKDLVLKAADHGFTVERTYEGIEHPTDVRKDPDGTWHIKAGAPVRIKINMATSGRRYHVALIDPLPGGLEATNPDLKVSAVTPVQPERPQPMGSARNFGWRWNAQWYEHQNLRDDRAEAFTSLLWDGVHDYSYEARATTPGTFIVPPPKAEEMYAPETFGRGASDRVVVE